MRKSFRIFTDTRGTAEHFHKGKITKLGKKLMQIGELKHGHHFRTGCFSASTEEA
jgi:hypothetical protein